MRTLSTGEIYQKIWPPVSLRNFCEFYLRIIIRSIVQRGLKTPMNSASKNRLLTRVAWCISLAFWVIDNFRFDDKSCDRNRR